MIRYQRRILSTQANVGQPGALPAELRGLADVSLADLGAALNPEAVALLGVADTGFFPVTSPDVPQVVDRLQFVTALQNAGSYTAVANAVNALPVGDPVRLYFTHTSNFNRTDPRLLAFAAAMGQSAAQVDTVFIAAALITP